jgi:hypothetical protein
MILDMIQGCRYLRRSTDRWLLSKNSTTRLKDSKDGMGPVCCKIVRSLLQTLRVYIYILVLTRLLVDHEYNIYCLKLMLRCQCPSRTRHQFVPSLYSGHVITYSWMLPFPAQNSPSAEWWCATDRKYLYRMLWGKFSVEWCFFTKLGPQVSLFPVPIFGVNSGTSSAGEAC